MRCGEVFLTGTYLLLNKYKTFITVVNLFLVRETQGRFIKDVMEQLSLDIRSIPVPGRYLYPSGINIKHYGYTHPTLTAL